MIARGSQSWRVRLREECVPGKDAGNAEALAAVLCSAHGHWRVRQEPEVRRVMSLC